MIFDFDTMINIEYLFSHVVIASHLCFGNNSKFLFVNEIYADVASSDISDK